MLLALHRHKTSCAMSARPTFRPDSKIQKDDIEILEKKYIIPGYRDTTSLIWAYSRKIPEVESAKNFKELFDILATRPEPPTWGNLCDYLCASSIRAHAVRINNELLQGEYPEFTPDSTLFDVRFHPDSRIEKLHIGILHKHGLVLNDDDSQALVSVYCGRFPQAIETENFYDLFDMLATHHEPPTWEDFYNKLVKSSQRTIADRLKSELLLQL